MPETDPVYRFDDGAAYERFMGRWSRGAGKVFLDWIAPARGARWLDVGCGTGSFTELIVNMGSPASVSAIDPEQSQIDQARHGAFVSRISKNVRNDRVLRCSEGLLKARFPGKSRHDNARPRIGSGPAFPRGTGQVCGAASVP